LWVVGCGLWVVGCGLWVVGCGLWVVGCLVVWLFGCLVVWLFGCWFILTPRPGSWLVCAAHASKQQATLPAVMPTQLALPRKSGGAEAQTGVQYCLVR
jgi:hypothetical protein